MSRTFGKKVLVAIAGAGVAAIVGKTVVRQLRRYDFTDRVVLITGGSRGLGLAMARHLTQEGALVAFCARDEAEIERAVHDIAQYGHRPLGVQCDVTDQNEIEKMLEAVRTPVGDECRAGSGKNHRCRESWSGTSRSFAARQCSE